MPTVRLLKGRAKGRELLVVGENQLFAAHQVTPSQRSQRYSRAIRPGFPESRKRSNDRILVSSIPCRLSKEARKETQKMLFKLASTTDNTEQGKEKESGPSIFGKTM